MSSSMHSKKRAALLRELGRLGRRMIFGTLSATSRTCGQPGCRCHHGGPKHGPHVQISYRGETGKTTGYHVLVVLQEPVREGVAAWQQFHAVARQVAELNRARAWARSPTRRAR